MNTTEYTKTIKHTAYQTAKLPLQDPIDGKALCESIAENFDEALGTLLNSAKEHGIEIVGARVLFNHDNEDGHSFGCFQIVAAGVEKEGTK